MLRGDARRLQQVLTNLIANAVKFTDQGEITLDAKLDSQSDNSASIRFTVTDTGIGIRADQIPALFSPFVQADASTTRKYGGSGSRACYFEAACGDDGGQHRRQIAGRARVQPSGSPPPLVGRSRSAPVRAAVPGSRAEKLPLTSP